MKLESMRPPPQTRQYLASGENGSDEDRWRAIVRRDPKADGAFYYSVKTTGIYCRPSCAARRPRRQNVQFHDSTAAAEQAGFRPCKRCQPDGPILPKLHAAKVANACRLIETAEEGPSLALLARTAAMSKFHFHRVFTKLTGLTPKAYTMAQRAERLRKALPQRRTVTEAIYAAGFNSNSRFYAKAAEMLGMFPSHFRNGGAGELIRFAVGKCSLGSLLVAASARGVCAISLGDDPAKLRRDLQARFPNARLRGGGKTFARLVARVVDLVESPKSGLDLPLDVRGTVFQQKVWQALRGIPAGSTLSYTQLARRLGTPKAVRAVAGACAANAIAVAIPCHRVLRTDGQLAGYRWGVARKRALLQREAAQASRRTHR